MKSQTEPMISVIIPCYNQGQYINQAVQSVLDQTYQNFEIIIIDDGSTDKKTQNLLKNYDRLKTKVYRTKNQGASNARNYGYSLARGGFIQFLDADDFLDKNKFKEQIGIFERDKKVDICYTNYKYYIEETGEYHKPYLPVKLTNNPLQDFLYRWQRDLSIPIHSAMFKKSLWKGSKPFIEGFGVAEDWIMWTKLANQGCQFFLLNKERAFYRIHTKSMTHRKDYVIYWATRAIAYIAENIVGREEIEKYNIVSEKYLQQLINELYLNEKNSEIEVYKYRLNEIYKSFSWQISLPIRILEKFVNLVKKQGFFITLRNIFFKIYKKITNSEEHL